MGRGDLTNREWSLLEPHLPPLGGRGGRWNDHRTVVNGILFRVRTGVPWRDLPERYGSWKTIYERHRRWSADGTWDRILQSVQADADLAGRIDWSMVGVDSTSCRAHQHAAGARKTRPRVPKKRTTPRHHRPDEGLGRSRGGLTCKIHLAGEGGCRPLALLLTPGQWGDAPQLVEVLDRIRVPRPLGGRPRTRPDHVSGDKAYSSRRNRRYLRRRRIRHTIPEPKDQRANRRRRGREGGRPAGFDRDHYRRRNEVERTINRLKNFRAVATRYDKRAYVFHGTVTAAAIRLWLRQ
ncbi:MULTISPECIES: IS5-like element IS1648 family transposase [Streptomyces]|uniref:IS5-like element IS1648 family transposase n=1 Tax=Streptomyces TaxID=1883 RepID=UPI000A3B3536|nr:MULTISPECIES: IS5-like element IS1648 family transposase [Streptomyces]MDX2930442.1 IS5-like element IS1648 family transposase [Streptomyces sp. NRRL_B-16638]MYU43515.1 IS5-like element IS1648 family transposase [Streptomyces sp. SID7813]MYU45153.1 IS5-like element IS1648 family transposase [Streptomyces sp. SID7813]MYU45903.1 IS5-like element IS1648 family transposase [Streptomyces sp. SID7813]NSL85176.1 IS5-like element IS1648 family transposase [Streptomyces coelicolor]